MDWNWLFAQHLDSMVAEVKVIEHLLLAEQSFLEETSALSHLCALAIWKWIGMEMDSDQKGFGHRLCYTNPENHLKNLGTEAVV